MIIKPYIYCLLILVPSNRGEAKRKSKAIGFGGKFESMFHNADNVPETSFTCSSQQFPGLYADPEVDCRVCNYRFMSGI